MLNLGPACKEDMAWWLPTLVTCQYIFVEYLFTYTVILGGDVVLLL